MSFSTLRRESIVHLEFLSQDLKFVYAARYGDGSKEEMEVNNTVVEIPYKVELKIGYTQGWAVPYECPSIEYDVTGKANFLQDFVSYPEDLMKILMCIICPLLGDYTSGPHLCPGEKVLLVRKDYADRPPKFYKKKSYLAGDMIAPYESQEINNFLYEENFNLMSVLWLLSEFALLKFGQQRQ